MQAFNRTFVSIVFILICALCTVTAVRAQSSDICPNTPRPLTCIDDIDNDGDGRADWDGGPVNSVAFPPDPLCANACSSEVSDDVAEGSLIPCTNKCDLGSVFSFINTLIGFLIKVVLFPVSIVIFIYTGYKYITSGGNPSVRTLAKKQIKNLIFGMVIILTAWLVVKTLLVIIGYDQTLYFFE